MKVAVVGLWHLGCVTAACLAQHHSVLAYDPDKKRVADLQNGKSPLFEPALDELLSLGIKNSTLHYSFNPKDISESDIVWITFDTPVDENDVADIAFVEHQVNVIAPYLKNNSLVLISSQLLVGTTRQLQQKISAQFPEKKITFGYSPENLRLGNAIKIFTKPDRIVVGLENKNDQEKIIPLLQPFSRNIIWMSIESAEMTKHALNAFLALSVTFANELAALCEKVGANSYEVEKGLKTEERIGGKAYLRPGGAIAGGTLLRDIYYLNEIGRQKSRPTFLLSAISESNDYHKTWVHRQITEVFTHLKNKTVAMLGLTYKAYTDTLRRSLAVETCQWLHQQGVKVHAYDPVINVLPAELKKVIDLKCNLRDAIHNADAVIIATEWPQFRDENLSEMIHVMKTPVVFDPNGFLMNQFSADCHIQYYSVGCGFGTSSRTCASVTIGKSL